MTKIGGKALPHHGGNGKIPGGIPHLRHHRDDGLEETRKHTSIVLIHQEKSCTSELFKAIQDAVSLTPTLQDNVVIPHGFFKYIYHVGCAINLHSIINSGLIPGGQILSNRQTVFFLHVDPMDKSHKDPVVIDLSVPRHAQYLHKSWKKHQDAVYWVDINLAVEKGLKFYQTRSNAIIPQETPSSLLYSESC